MSAPAPSRPPKVTLSGEIPLGPPPSAARKKSVLIVGGGIAGLTVAHELSRHRDQFDITVCEQNPVLGGKARSERTPDHRPTEHAMRVLLASYTCLYRVMEEVKDAGGAPLMSHLEYPRFAFRNGPFEYAMSAGYSGFFRYLRDALGMTRLFLRSGVTWFEMLLFLWRVGRILWSTQSQVNTRMGRVSFEEYMDGPDRTPAFRTTLLRVSEMLVAAKRTASAAVVARLVLEWFVGPFLKSPFNRRGFASLDGPTSERLIDPWKEHLAKLGVRFRYHTRAVRLREEAREIAGIEVRDPRKSPDVPPEVLTADFYCLCLPHLALDQLVRGRLAQFLPTISDLTQFGEEWSSGIQYHLPSVPERLRGTEGLIVVDVASPWSIVYMLHANGAPWKNVPLPAGTAAVLSLVMSNGRNSGQHVTTKPFVRCTAEDMKNEALAQLGLLDELRAVPFAIGPDLEFLKIAQYRADPARYAAGGVSKIDDEQVIFSDGLLYVRMPQNLDEEPANFTDIHNLFIAGEFTRTRFSTPTMEKSCESGMRCAAALSEANGLDYDEGRLAGAELPLAFLRRPGFHLGCRIAGVALLAAAAWLLAVLVPKPF